MNPVFVVEETLPSGLRYTEETNRIERSLPMRDCLLWQADIDEPVSGLNVVPFRQRFGAAAIPAEGIGGVETLPAHRRMGHMGTLMTRALAGISSRVPVVFVADAIDHAYKKYGFVNCLAESDLTLHVRDIERMAKQMPISAGLCVREFSPEDLPSMVRLYNAAHFDRSWTHERHADWNRLVVTETWQPGSAVIILERESQIAGYAIFREPIFGIAADQFSITEFTAKDSAAAQALLVDLAARCWEMRLSEFKIREPVDSVVGWTAQRIGCRQQQAFQPGGGMMGAILDRLELLRLLEAELRRRLSSTELLAAHPAAFEALCGGKIITDNRLLLRLLIGHWSMTQARAYGVIDAGPFEQILEAWFPGGGTRWLPQPYSHVLDRY